jgi:hypothetical protein
MTLGGLTGAIGPPFAEQTSDPGWGSDVGSHVTMPVRSGIPLSAITDHRPFPVTALSQ